MKPRSEYYVLPDGRIVRKVEWDALWHVIRWNADNRLVWNRITRDAAMKLVEKKGGVSI